MVTLPKQYWNRIEDLADSIEGGLSDGLFMVVDLGFKALDNEDAMELLVGRDKEEEEEEEEEEDDSIFTVIHRED